MNYFEQILNSTKEHKKNNVNQFIELVKQELLNDVEGTAKIYSRDKGKEGYTVVKLKSGIFAVIDKFKDIIYKHDDVHYCKVECIILQQIKDETFTAFTNKL